MIDIPNRSINVDLSEEILLARRNKMEADPKGFHPGPRQRVVSKALQAYAMFATSADRGAVRDLNQVVRR